MSSAKRIETALRGVADERGRLDQLLTSIERSGPPRDEATRNVRRAMIRLTSDAMERMAVEFVEACTDALTRAGGEHLIIEEWPVSPTHIERVWEHLAYDGAGDLE